LPGLARSTCLPLSRAGMGTQRQTHSCPRSTCGRGQGRDRGFQWTGGQLAQNSQQLFCARPPAVPVPASPTLHSQPPVSLTCRPPPQ
jgi:hypothetical protein